MKKTLVLLSFFLITSLSSFANESKILNVEPNITSETQIEVVSKNGEPVVADNDYLKSLTICTSGLVLDSNGSVVGDWFYCDFGRGAFLRITIY